MNYSEHFEEQTVYKYNLHFFHLLSALILFAMLFSTNLMAQGDLLVFPKRVVFEGNLRFQELNLANTGSDTARYAISFVQIRMKEDGGFENIIVPDSGQHFADGYLRFFPRTVTLAPNEVQLVKIQLTKASMLTQGEFRSHMYFRADPNIRQIALGEKETPSDSTSVSVRLVPIFGMTIPVIIRVGESTTKVNLSNLSFEMINDTIPVIKFVINRNGNMSVYGDLKVEHISSLGKITEVGNVQGVAVYTPNLLRRCVIRLDNIPDIDYRSGKLRVIYSAQRDDKNAELADGVLQLQ